jgi:hypothetical protein
VCCPGCKRPLGDVYESIVRQRGRFKAQREQSRKECLRLRDALWRISWLTKVNTEPETRIATVRRITEEALDEGFEMARGSKRAT